MQIKRMFVNLKKYRKIYITLAVIFFAVGITIQIVAIKLAGGFFYAKEAHVQIVQKNNYDIDLLAISRLDLSLKFLTPHNRGLIASVFTNIFVLSFVFSVLVFARHNSVLFCNFYESDCRRIRPPIVIK